MIYQTFHWALGHCNLILGDEKSGDREVKPLPKASSLVNLEDIILMQVLVVPKPASFFYRALPLKQLNYLLGNLGNMENKRDEGE